MYVCVCVCVCVFVYLVVHYYTRCGGAVVLVVEKRKTTYLVIGAMFTYAQAKKPCKAIKWRGDKTCDDENNHAGCDWDGNRTFAPLASANIFVLVYFTFQKTATLTSKNQHRRRLLRQGERLQALVNGVYV